MPNTESTPQHLLPPPRKPREPRPSDGIHVADAAPEQVELSADLPPELEFDPVPHVPKKGMKFTPEKQRMFVGALAACGSVTVSVAALNMSTGQVYHLRQRAGGESFAAAWDKAVARGALRVRDVLVDQAINGIPETVYGPDGQVLIERRRFNTRMMMWIVAHHLPEQYGVTGGLMHSASGPVGLKRLQAKWKAEGVAEAEERAARYMDPEKAKAEILRNVAAVRRHTLEQFAADPVKRAAYETLYGPDAWDDIGVKGPPPLLPHSGGAAGEAGGEGDRA